MAKTYSSFSLFTACNKYGFLLRLTGIQLDTDKEKEKCGDCAHQAAECCSHPAHSSVPWGRLQLHLCSSLRLSLRDCNAHAALLQAKLGVFLGFVYKYFQQESDTLDRKARSKLGMQHQVEVLLASDVTLMCPCLQLLGREGEQGEG